MLKWLFEFTSPAKLKKAGVLGMNKRNFSYIMPSNPRRLYPLVDDKLATKLLAAKAGIPTPEMLGVISCQHDVNDFLNIIGDRQEFVIKPTHGSGGRGILVIKARRDEEFIKTDGSGVSFDFVYQHLSNILSGLYSLGGQPDKILIESCISFTDIFDGYSYQGVPDVRIIVYKGYPVMSMMRLSTAVSGGRANLHQGAVGVGIGISNGKAVNAIQNGRIVYEHPDTGKCFEHIVIPDWETHLDIAARCYEMTRLGYFGADIVIDHKLGPMVLELNARPGLGIQTANGAGITRRLELVDSLDHEELPPPRERIAFSRAHFA
ncbi:MAG: alpha-L-glutamate ligase-like protein [Victivallales bacterium]|nr:alpha-L-glutamate ligase-like protein [Victivallales bacterium]